jgi:hypothetical protein
MFNGIKGKKISKSTVKKRKKLSVFTDEISPIIRES